MTRTIILISTLLWACGTSAQQSVVDHCRKTSSDADRIQCLEAALLGREMRAKPDKQAQIDPPSLNIEAGPADVSGAPPAQRPVGIGADQVIVRTQTQHERLASLEAERGLQVASYSKVPYEKLLVRLENGQVWRQIKGDTQTIRVNLKRNQTVDIEESSFGGYKLRLNEIRRTIRVERVQ